MSYRRSIFAFVILVVGILPVRPIAAAEPSPDTPYLLSMPDLSSPRATLDALQENAKIVERLFVNEGIAWTLRPATLRMVATIDTAELTSAHPLVAAGLAAFLITATLDRLPPEQLAGAPDEAAVRRSGIKQWQIPGTAIVIAQVTTGEHAGQFLFSPQTVARAADLYRAAKDMPRQAGSFERALDNWIVAPGPLLPQSIVAALPGPLLTSMFGQAIWQWICLVVLLTAYAASALYIARWGIRHDSREIVVVRRYGQPIASLVIIGLSTATVLLAFFGIKIWGDALEIVILTMRVLRVGATGWFVIVMIHRVGELIASHRGVVDTGMHQHLIKVICTLVSIGVVITALFLTADLFGIPLEPLIAGLGIGGLAIALAIRPTLENVIGGLTLFADRPVRVGEFCRFGADSGTVEEIGLRTTKIRRLDDTLLSISNSEAAQVRIENVTRRRKFLFNPRLGLRYETTVEQLGQIETKILEMLNAHPKVLDLGLRVRLSGFGDYTLNVDVFAYVDVARLPEFVVVQEELNLLILTIVQDAGASFAFPSQTHYLAKDTLAAAAESV